MSEQSPVSQPRTACIVHGRHGQQAEVVGPPDLRRARHPDGSPRFYPPGQHPATAQWRANLTRLKGFQDVTPAGFFGKPSETEKAIDYVEKQLAAFETAEELAKRAYLSRLASGSER